MNSRLNRAYDGPVGQVRPFGRDLEREEVLRVVAGIHVTERPEAAHQQP